MAQDWRPPAFDQVEAWLQSCPLPQPSEPMVQDLRPPPFDQIEPLDQASPLPLEPLFRNWRPPQLPLHHRPPPPPPLRLPCAACTFNQVTCPDGCVLAPYFPWHMSQKFKKVHKVFSVNSMIDLLIGLPLRHRQAAVDSLAYEAHNRAKDPTYGSTSLISHLKRQVEELQAEIVSARSDLAKNAQAGGAQTAGPAGNSLTQTSPYSSLGIDTNLPLGPHGREQQQHTLSRDAVWRSLPFHIAMEQEHLTNKQLRDNSLTQTVSSSSPGIDTNLPLGPPRREQRQQTLSGDAVGRSPRFKIAMEQEHLTEEDLQDNSLTRTFSLSSPCIDTNLTLGPPGRSGGHYLLA